MTGEGGAGGGGPTTRRAVVGTRGFGRFRAALGSVAHALLHEADRPVVVVPLGSTTKPGPS